MSKTSHTHPEEFLSELAWLLQLESRTWAIVPETLLSMRAMNYDEATLQQVAAHLADTSAAAAARPRSGPTIEGDVQVIKLKGVITPNVSILALIFGLGSGLSMFREDLRQAAADPDVGAIVLDIDSPGGVVDLIPETAAEVREAAAQKPVVAVANTLIASAAYWIASGATEIVVTPSGEVGSIGVYAEHRDISAALEEAGVKPTLVSAGKYKVEGNPYEPLDEEAYNAIQTGVNDYYNAFVKDVAKGRNVSVGDVKNGYGEGRVLTAQRAVDAGLADKVATLDETIQGFTRRSRSTMGSRQSKLGEGETIEYSAEDRERLVAMASILDYNHTTEEG